MTIIMVIFSLFLSFTIAEDTENNLLLDIKDEEFANLMSNSHTDCLEGTENIDNFPGYICSNDCDPICVSGTCCNDGECEPICVPLLFSTVIQSSQQAFYYFESVEINGSSIDDGDWVGAFNGDVCVGARQWDFSICLSGTCDVPVLGYSSIMPETSTGYMQSGGIPSFKIYDVSNNTYYDAISSEDIPWNNGAMPLINTLSAICNDVETPCLSIHQPMAPYSYEILNIYPNPFNPMTMIKYNLPINTNVLILVYDIHGKQVELLINQFQTAGQHSINWNASSHSSGLYLIRMENEILPQTHKAILIK